MAATPEDAPLLIRQVAPGGAEYVMLQMTVDGQSELDGETLQLYGHDGSLARSFPLGGEVPVATAGRAILIANQDAADELAAVSVTPDFSLGAGEWLEGGGGAVCVAGRYPADCVTWANFPSITTPAGAALPDPQSGQAARDALGTPVPLPDGASLRRRIDSPCATWLDPADDTGVGRADFEVLAPGGPAPRGNSEAPPGEEAPCALETIIAQRPANPSSDPTPTFTLHEEPASYDTSFSCALQAGPFVPCDPDSAQVGPLADGLHTFHARATGRAGTDATPDSWTWEVDTVPPDTTIDSGPPSPSSGFSASFAFHSSEHHPSFRCQLDDGFAQVCESGRSYFLLEDGRHTFRVWSSDQATNTDPTPAVRVFEVDTTIGDRTPPNTKIVEAPADPSQSSRSTFVYVSTEPGSVFQCRLDDRPFAACPATGISYPPQRNGRHVFRVRAVDRAGNLDEVADSHAWTIKAALPRTFLTRVPPGASYLRRGSERARLSFAFRSNARAATFRCRLDKGRFRRCRSPHKLRVDSGRHLFEVRARDSVGNLDPTPERWIFRIVERGARGLFG